MRLDLAIKSANSRERILKAAVELAQRPGGWSTLTRAGIASAADCSDGLVSKHLGNMSSVRREVAHYAVRNQVLSIITQSLAAHDGFIVKSWLPKPLKMKALRALVQ